MSSRELPMSGAVIIGMPTMSECAKVVEDVIGSQDTEFLHTSLRGRGIAAQDGIAQKGRALTSEQAVEQVHAPYRPQFCTQDSMSGASRLSITACTRRFNIATTPALQDGIAKELSEAGLLASGEQREPRLPEYEDVASKLPYLSAVRMLPLMPSLHSLYSAAAQPVPLKLTTAHVLL